MVVWPAAIITVAFIIVRKELFHNHFQKCCDQQSSTVVTADQSVDMPSSTSVLASEGNDALTASDAAVASARATIATAATASPLASAAVTTTLGQSSSSSTKPTTVLAMSTATEPARTAEMARMAAAVNPHVGAAQIIQTSATAGAASAVTAPERTAFVFTVPAATKSYGKILTLQNNKITCCFCNMQLLRKNLKTHMQRRHPSNIRRVLIHVPKSFTVSDGQIRKHI